ncbi:DUF4230 domain-containing protein [Flavobacterium cucumis]|uniref:DUF4230 domain-containing protein n=1 Tax=Flavobacterium cucumis TaxID=416016 RepID=A0A1M7ZTF5_9FLAO|nr:DUF4230 domain-containing protein [Flavobacterium cucumis]SHO71897.1 Protein of unknown function [Flavobacterium cucumis]
MARTSSTETQIKNMLIPVVQAIGRSGKLIYLLILLVVGFLLYQFFTKSSESSTVEYNSALIEKQIRSVGKLVVTEGHYAEVITYKDQQKYFMDFITFEKKALIVANADVLVMYDLRQLQYDIDEKNKTVTLKKIPDPELKINQDLHFYDVDQSRFNPFNAQDYNKINKKVKAELTKKIEKSSLKSNAKNRLLSELSKILILTNTMGWTLRYDGREVKTDKDIELKIN